MILLDAFALIAHFTDEPAAPEVRELLRRGSCTISAVNLAEVLDNLLRRRELDRAEVFEAIGPLLEATVTVRDVTAPTAWRAAELRARHYRPATTELSLADCILVASALPSDAIASADPAVIAVARHEQIDVIPLPDSGGRRP